MPDPAARCEGDRADLACAGRIEAMRAGAFRFQLALGGWVDASIPRRRATWEARSRNEDAQDGVPYVFEVCPFCGGDLPDLDTAIRRALGQGDGAGD